MFLTDNISMKRECEENNNRESISTHNNKTPEQMSSGTEKSHYDLQQMFFQFCATSFFKTFVSFFFTSNSTERARNWGQSNALRYRHLEKGNNSCNHFKYHP